MQRILMRFLSPIHVLPLLPLVAAAVLLVRPPQAEAQFRFIPSVGSYAPLADLGELRDDTGATLLDLGRSSSTAAIGLAVEVGGAEGAIGLRLGTTWASRSPLPVEGTGCEGCSARSSLLLAGGTLIIRPLPRLLFVQPHFLLGGGSLWYSFDDRELRDGGWEDVLINQRQRHLQFGVGSTLHLGFVRPLVELNVHVSGFDPGDGPQELSSSGKGDRQGSVFLTVGIPLGE
jgi:hypothetical protein